MKKHLAQIISWSAAFGSLGARALTPESALQIPGVTQYDVGDFSFTKANYVGRYTLIKDRNNLARVGLGDARLGADAYYKFFTTSVKLEEGTPAFIVPDMLYPVKSGATADTYGARFVPVAPMQWDEAGNPVGNPAAELNKVLRNFFYGDANADKYVYAFLPHSFSHEVYYTDFSEMAAVKVETSTHHVSAYTSPSHDQGTNSRRGMLDRGSINNVFAVSVRGVPQEAVNTNLGIWTKLYYQNPEGYQFSEDYHFDWVTGVNPEETLAFATAWIDHDWRRRDLNKLITQKAAELGRPKEAPLDAPYYKLLQEHKMLGIYCFEGVANMIYVGLNVPLTRNYFQRIWGRNRGLTMFQMVNDRWVEIQKSELRRWDNQGNELPLTPEELAQIETLDSPRLATALSQMKALWEMEGGIKNAVQYGLGATPAQDNPLYPDRDENGIALSDQRTDLGIAPPLVARSQEADAALRLELAEFGKALPWKPETTSEILRDLMYLYGPYHKVSGVRSTALVLSFQAEFYKRTGISKDVFRENATKIVKKIFLHEANWRLAQLLAAPLTEDARAAAFADYKERTAAGLRHSMAALKASRENRGFEAIDELVQREAITAEEAQNMKQNLIAFRRERNRAAAQMGEELLVSDILPVIESVYTEDPATHLRRPGVSAIAGYPAAGGKSWAKFYASVESDIEELNKIPVKEPDLIKQAILEQRYVKYNNRPGLPIVLAHGIHKTHPLVSVYPVVTAINEEYIEERTGGDAQDPGLSELQAMIAQFTRPRSSSIKPTN